MILLLLLACAADKAPETDTSSIVEAPFQPAGGEWQMSVADTWQGDCALADMGTHQSATQTWVLDPRGDSVNILPNVWELMPCALAGAELTCDAGSWSVDDSSGTASLTHLLVGSFADASHFEGAFTIDLSCEGRVCRSLRSLYGEDLEPPCSVSAAVSGEALGD